MGISFNDIPANLRTPGTYIEFDNSLASLGAQEFKILVIGQRLAAGTVAAGEPTLVTRAEDANTWFGAGSMLAAMLAMALDVGPSIPVWAIALDDNGAGAAATGTVTISTPPTAAGTVNLYIAGQRVQAGVGASDTVTNVADAVVAAITADTSLPVTASNVAGVITLTAKHKGEVGNDIDLRDGYYSEALPTGVSLTYVAMSGGTSNPDMATAITAMGDDWYNWIASPYTDAANLAAMTSEMNDRWGPMQQIDGRVFVSYRDTLANVSTFGNGLNDPHLSCMAADAAPQPPYIWAAVNCATAAKYLSIDPARPLQTLVLKGILPPAKTKQWIQDERNTLLFDGIATHKVDSAGLVRIERQITTYQKNAAGLIDASYLDINTPETLSRLRFRQRQMFAQRYPRHKLADNGTNYPAGQAIITPNIAALELLALFQSFIELGWVEDYDAYKATLITEINSSDPNRLDYRDQPNLVNQLRVVAGQTQFIV